MGNKYTKDIEFADIMDDRDFNFFKKAQFNNHCLNHLMPKVHHSSHVLVYEIGDKYLIHHAAIPK